MMRTLRQPPVPRTRELVRGLGLLDSISLIIGITIGSGIFLATGTMAEAVPSPELLLLAWAVGGVVTLAGALTFAELGAALPEAGGPYVYLREAYGPLPAFLYGWIIFLVYQPGAIAAVAVGFAIYLSHFFPALGSEHILLAVRVLGHPIPIASGQLVASGLILLLTGANVLGLRTGSSVQNVSTALKVGAIVLFIMLGFVVDAAPTATPPPPTGMTPSFAGFGVALVAALWAYDGWINLNFSAGEIRDPGRTIPRALIFGTAAVAAVYLLINVVYLRALPMMAMRGAPRVAEQAATALFGPGAAVAVVIAVLVSTFGSTNGSILTGARIPYAMAKDGLFFRGAGRVHPRYQTPHVALWLQAAWSCVFALTGSFDRLLTYTVFAALLMYGAATMTVFTLRRSRPELPRPYRAWGYPVLPAVYLVMLAAIVISTFVERPFESFAGTGVLALGVPVYLVWSRFADNSSPAVARSEQPGFPASRENELL